MPDFLWLLLLLNLAVMVVWFCHDASAGMMVDSLWGLWVTQDGKLRYLWAFLRWRTYGSRFCAAVVFVSLQIGGLTWLATRIPAGDLMGWIGWWLGVVITIGVISLLPKFWQWSGGYRIWLRRRHFIAILETLRHLPRDDQSTFKVNGVTYRYLPDPEWTTGFLLKSHMPLVPWLEGHFIFGIFTPEQDRISLAFHEGRYKWDYLVEAIPDDIEPLPIQVTPYEHYWTYHFRDSKSLAPGFRLSRYEQVESEEMKKMWEECEAG